MGGARRVPVTVVCVYNDDEVLARCLERSVAAGLGDAPQTELIAVDNRGLQFRSAGAALNDGASRARNSVVVLAHQDVYLHSLVALEQAAARLVDDPATAVAGAVGITRSGEIVGRVRDRVVMLGRPATQPTVVDSLDEVLFMVTRDLLRREPLTEDPDLAWHAYAVEYGARMRSRGLRVVADDIPLTHNSMTTNLARLAEAHQRVAELYPGSVPLRTTCGTVRATGDRGRLRTAWRRRHGVAGRLGETVAAVRAARAAGCATSEVVVGDIRWDVDTAAELLGADGIEVVNVVPEADPGWTVDGLARGPQPLQARQAGSAQAPRTVETRRSGRALLVTGLDTSTLRALVSLPAVGRPVVGLSRDVGTWLLVHENTEPARDAWASSRNRPLPWRPARRPRPVTSATEGGRAAAPSTAPSTAR